MTKEKRGFVHSIQSLGTLDGPGIRFVVFLQGCNLRCGCCHNPDTWTMQGAKEYTAKEIVDKAERYKEYFGTEGGITLSGGEPLLQAEFAREIFSLAHERGINTCLDTSGSILNDSVRALLSECDVVMLDLKYSTDEDYRKYVGCSVSAPQKFLDELEERKIKTIVRRVIIPTLNDSEDETRELVNFTRGYACVEKIELLPFKKICQVKYDKMGIEFPFAALPTPSAEQMKRLCAIVDEG